MTGFMDYGKSSSTAGTLTVDCGCKLFPGFCCAFSSGACFCVFHFRSFKVQKNSKGQGLNSPMVYGQFITFKIFLFFFLKQKVMSLKLFFLHMSICVYNSHTNLCVYILYISGYFSLAKV